MTQPTQKKVLVMCCNGIFQDHLIRRMHQEHQVCGIVRHQYPDTQPLRYRIFSRLKQPATFIRHLIVRAKLRKYQARANQFIQKTIRAELLTGQQDINSIPVFHTNDVNNNKVVAFIQQHQPDIICVNGTNLLKEHLIEELADIPFGVINLHTGLSPYSRGGNCNLFMLLEKRPELVGITIHHINRGIDSGDIIISARPAFTLNDNYEIIDAKCFFLGIEAMLEATRRLFNNTSDAVKQWQTGTLFLKCTGYVYDISHRLNVNQLIDNGLIRNYLQNQQQLDKHVTLIGEFNPDHV